MFMLCYAYIYVIMTLCCPNSRMIVSILHTKLTPEKVASGLAVLLSKEVGRNAQRLAVRMNAENGVKTSLDCFYNHIHLENMVCDVSIFLGESRVAQVWCRQCRFKMNKEVCEIIHDSSNPNKIKVCSMLEWRM